MLRKFPRIIAFSAGFLSATGFAPLGLWPVTIGCFALFLWLVADAPDRRSALWRGWLFGLGQFTLGLNWIVHAFTFQDAMPHWFGYGAVVLLSLYLALFPALAAGLAFVLSRPPRPAPMLDLPFVLLAAVIWMITEYLRASLFTGFAWNPLGVIWMTPLPLAAGARWIGTYGLSGLTMLVAGGIALLSSRTQRRAGLGLLALLALVMAAAALTRPVLPPADKGFSIVVVQPNIGQQDKYDASFEARNFEKLATLSGSRSGRPRLIFWPEAAIPAFLDIEPEWREGIAGLLGPNDLLMTGGDKIYFSRESRGAATGRTITGANNSLWVLTPDARLIGRYDKAHLVPFGEYLPMREWLTPIGLSRLVPGDTDFWPGPGPRTLSLPAAPPSANGGRPPLKMGVQICYEIIFSGQVVDEAHRPDFIFNPSNDAWFGNWGPPQHLAQARLRALEEGIPVIRATPTGVSAVVGADGDLIGSLPHKQPGTIDALLPPPGPRTFFSRLGNLAPASFALLLVFCAVAMRRRRR